ncbi:putative integrase [Delftia acidovorans]|nr:putative integrase [Delftia acidovorans]
MSSHQQLATNAGARVYFCVPHSPWPCSICESTDGLLPHYLPKGMDDLTVRRQDDLEAAIADGLNGRPHATGGFNTPLAVFSHLLAMAQQGPCSCSALAC